MGTMSDVFGTLDAVPAAGRPDLLAAPVLAGQLAARLAADRTLPELDAKAGVQRGWAAITAEVGWRP